MAAEIKEFETNVECLLGKPWGIVLHKIDLLHSMAIQEMS